MSIQPGKAIIRGVPSWPNINVRLGPGTGHPIVFKLDVGVQGAIVNVQRDDAGNDFQGKVYQWLKLRLEDGREGWARDDLVDLLPADHSAIGYGVVIKQVIAFSLDRDESVVVPNYPPDIIGNADHAVPVVEPASDSIWQPADPAADPTTPEPDPTPEEPPVTEPATPIVTFPVSAEDIAIVIGAMTAINVRSGPSTNHERIARWERGTRLKLIDVQPQTGGGHLKWAQVSLGGEVGWVREDLLSFAGPMAVDHGLIKGHDMYPAPMQIPGYWWVRGYEGHQPNHPGWDIGAVQGEPMLAGPHGGTVIRAFRAAKPTPTKPRTIDHGIQLGDPSVFSDEGWGFGYGHFVVVKYAYDLLPASTKDLLDAQGKTGGAVFAMYAHLHTVDVSQGQQLEASQQIGTCGTTGNSQAPHVHLEIRAWKNANETSWARMRTGLVTPGMLFNR